MLLIWTRWGLVIFRIFRLGGIKRLQYVLSEIDHTRLIMKMSPYQWYDTHAHGMRWNQNLKGSQVGFLCQYWFSVTWVFLLHEPTVCTQLFDGDILSLIGQICNEEDWKHNNELWNNNLLSVKIWFYFFDSHNIITAGVQVKFQILRIQILLPLLCHHPDQLLYFWHSRLL